jgi:hypothetical protein
MLDQREKELTANFESIGKKVEGDMGAANQADLLSDLE